MLKKEWLGNEELIEKLLLKAKLFDNGKLSERKFLMRYIITHRYIEYMTIEEICGSLILDYNIEISRSKFNRLLKEAISLMEK